MTGSGHEHVASVRWRNPIDNATGENTRAVMVDRIDNKDGDARGIAPEDDGREVSHLQTLPLPGANAASQPITAAPSAYRAA